MGSRYPGGSRRRSGGSGSRGLPYSKAAAAAMSNFQPPLPGNDNVPGAKGLQSKALKAIKLATRLSALKYVEYLLPMIGVTDPEVGLVYDMTGWGAHQQCTQDPVSGIRAIGTSNCLILQGVSFPAIEPHHEWCCTAHKYEVVPDLFRLRWVVVYHRDIPNIPINPPRLMIPGLVYVPGRPVLVPADVPFPGEGVTPVPAPYPLIPSMPSNVPIPGVPGRQIAYHPPARQGVGAYRPPAIVMLPGVAPLPHPESVPHVNRPPTVHEREKKLNIYMQGVLLGIVNFATETKDFVAALHKALPKECRAKPVRLGDWVPRTSTRARLAVTQRPREAKLFLDTKTDRVFVPYTEGYNRPRWLEKQRRFKSERTHRAPRVDEMAQAIWTCLGEISDKQWGQFIVDAIGEVAENQLEDYLFGKLGRTVAKANRNRISPAGLTLGPAL